VAYDAETIAKRRAKNPEVWALFEAFRGRYRGAVHVNWGGLFSLRTTIPEGRLEADFDSRTVYLRFEKAPRLPAGVFFSTSREHRRQYFMKLGDVGAAALGWPWIQASTGGREAAIRSFLARPQNRADFTRLALGPRDSISVHWTAGVFLQVATDRIERLVEAVETIRGLLRRYDRGDRKPEPPRTPRLTGRLPSPTQLKKWPNWRDCLDEEDEEGQDESTIRPSDDQKQIAKDATYTAAVVIGTDGRRRVGLLHNPFPGDLRKGRAEEVYVFEGARTRGLEIGRRTWQPGRFVERPFAADDRRLPLRVRSVLTRPSGRRIELVIEKGGRVR
jgi:hypothetical protein